MQTGAPCTSTDIAVVGAGAAGLATAIFAARRLPAARIVALDGARKLGAKILVSGGGRCNVTNVRVHASDFWGGSSNTVRNVLAAFDEHQTVEFFRELGVPLHEEQWGKLFPDSNAARTVLDALLAEARRLRVELRPGHRVENVKRESEGFRLTIRPVPPVPGMKPASVGAAEATPALALFARCVVLATGGRSLPKTGSDGGGYRIAEALGHTMVPTTPALAPLILEGGFHLTLSGIAQEVEVSVRGGPRDATTLAGPLLWTHFGASGPAMLDASRHWHRAREEGRSVEVHVNMLPGSNLASAESRWAKLSIEHPRLSLAHALATWLPARVAEAVIDALRLPPRVTLSNLSRAQRRTLLQSLLAWKLDVLDSRGYGYAEATAGGVPLTEVRSSTMESKLCVGLFLAGEILDVDGRIGGFNFQWAWSSAFVAAGGLARTFAMLSPGP